MNHISHYVAETRILPADQFIAADAQIPCVIILSMDLESIIWMQRLQE